MRVGPGGGRGMMPSVGKTAITADLAARLVAEQFPQWAGLPVRRVEPGGWDNVTFRLGADLSLRLPSGPGYAQQVDKEHRWLPVLARQLPVRIPEPLARGAPGCGFPWPWSVYRWLPGTPLAGAHVPDPSALAAELAGFLAALYQIDPEGGPPPGPHSCDRGAPVSVLDSEARQSLKALAGEIDTAAAAQVWEEAIAATWHGTPVWVHGDVADGNLLMDRGRLSAVIDFGCCAVGDPACDTVIAWTYFSGESRKVFKERLPVDRATWARGRGWALWKAMLVLVDALRDDPEDARVTKYVIAEVLSDNLRT
jgi:aminoglycoside phosphotransferase (APT) family kinase protein